MYDLFNIFDMRGAYLHVESEREETRPLLFIERVAKRDEGREALSSPWILLRRLFAEERRKGWRNIYIYIYKQRWDGEERGVRT